MFKNYYKIAWRNLVNHKMHSAINIGGFAMGIAACLLIALFIRDELSYDQHYPNGDRLYRAVLAYNVEGQSYKGATFPAPLANALKDEFPEVEQVGRLNQTEYFGAGSNEIRRADKIINTHEEGFAYADQGLLNILQLPMINGDRAHALDEPGTIVISKRKADVYFPNEDPIGKTFIINNNESKPYRVAGVIDFPTHSHFQCDFLMTLEGGLYHGEQNNWRSSSYYTYVLLHPGTIVAQLERKFSLITRKYIIPSQQQDGYVDAEKLADIITYDLQPIRDIHLKSAGIQDGLRHGDIRFVWLFGIIAGFILAIASINFINLSTAKSANRAKEVGLRKTVGSNKGNLIGQFLTESVLYSVLSFILGMMLAVVCLPYFNVLAAKSLTIPWYESWRIFPLLAFSSVIIGIMAGLYPSVYLSSFKPVSVLKGNLSRGSKSSRMRSGLVIFQFTISIVLIIGTLIIARQMNYILTKNVGFEKDQVMLLHGANTIGEQVASFKNELLQLPDVKSVTVSDFLPISGTKRDGNALWNDGKSKIDPPTYGQFWRVDHDYINTMGMNIIEGRNFSIDMPTDSKAAIINQKLARELGLAEPIGKWIQNQWHAFEVIGIVEDFHYESLKKGIGGLCFVLGNSPNIVSVKMSTAHMSGLIQSVTEVWNSFSPNQPIRYTFLDESFAMMYADVQRMGNIFSTFALLAIIVACLGLLALSSFMTAQRTKEIGIRKVLGASIFNVTFNLSKNFLALVVVANIIAWPVAYFFMNKWLQDFAYRIDIDWGMFMLAGGIALFIALLTVSWQAIKAAWANPVESLRYE
ncbi:ABC transporter permease [candidate division KSB1 bacterium]|nr:ABC transporter permease [candidate division KSB1 bacterium]